MTNLPITINGKNCRHATVHYYPDGQHNVTLDMEYFHDCKKPIDITCSVRNFSELEVLICIIQALRKNDFYINSVYFTYLFGMRSDRAFEIGMPNYFSEVLAPIINLLKIPEIKILQPHSLLSFNQIHGAAAISVSVDFGTNIIIAGDESTRRWSFYTPPFEFHFSKIREQGVPKVKLQKIFIEKINAWPSYSPIVIYDDLCDGGATFIAEAKYLKEIFPHRKLFLSVTHGLFTKGLDCLLEHFDTIFCTNSYQDIEHLRVKQMKVI